MVVNRSYSLHNVILFYNSNFQFKYYLFLYENGLYYDFRKIYTMNNILLLTDCPDKNPEMDENHSSSKFTPQIFHKNIMNSISFVIHSTENLSHSKNNVIFDPKFHLLIQMYLLSKLISRRYFWSLIKSISDSTDSVTVFRKSYYFGE